MFQKVQEFIQELQRSSEARKWRWLLGTSIFAGGVVIFLWNIQFSQRLAIPSPQIETTEQLEASLPTDDSPSILEMLARRLALLQDSVWSMFFGPSNIPVPQE
ncbi:MAG: hypothetical protein KGZ30_02320 [Anaplasmataceae bacterium]|nr:hypothetical protein [Anaplasmataceae bacterium]